MLSTENLDNKIKKFWPKNGPSINEVAKYVKKYLKEKIVIKCGGRVLLDPALLDSLIEDIATLKVRFNSFINTWWWTRHQTTIRWIKYKK